MCCCGESVRHVYSSHDFGWASSVVFTLYNCVISAKRGGASTSNADALGVLAYAKSFKSILKLRVDDGTYAKLVPHFNDDSLRDSIGAAKDKLYISEQTRHQVWVGSRTIVMASWALFMAIVSAIFALKPDKAETDPISTCMIKSVMGNFSYWFLVACLLSAILVLMRSQLYRAGWRIIWRLTLGLPKEFGVAVLVLLSIGVTYLSFAIIGLIEGAASGFTLSSFIQALTSLWGCLDANPGGAATPIRSAG